MKTPLDKDHGISLGYPPRFALRDLSRLGAALRAHVRRESVSVHSDSFSSARPTNGAGPLARRASKRLAMLLAPKTT